LIDVIGKKYYTAKEIAESLAVTPMTVYRLAERGELKAIRVGRSIRFDAEAVEEFMKNASLNTEKGTSDVRSTGKTLLEFFGKWSEDDAKEIDGLIRGTRSGGGSMLTTVSSRGQTSIPAQIRKRYGIDANTKLQWIDEGGVITIVPVVNDPIKSFRGKSKGKDLVESLLKGRSEERERDE
jgi:excisionase family DNA binding protein/AbrB family looped-hinge helix DNA binding protein